MSVLSAVAISLCITLGQPACADAPLGLTYAAHTRTDQNARVLRRGWDMARAYAAVELRYYAECRAGGTHPMCTHLQQELARFASVVDAGAGTSGRAQLDAVARAIKLVVRYEKDERDVWSSPLDTLARGTGDCEDYAFLARAALLALGWRGENIVVVAARSKRDKVGHAILAARYKNEWLYWDSAVDSVLQQARGRDVVTTHAEVLRFYEPHFALTERGVRAYIPSGAY